MYKVLIIDDEEPLREAIRILGEWDSLGVDTILEAEDGESGLLLLRQQQVDLVMVDMKMPGISGPELLQILEQDFPDLPSIVISGYNDFEFTRQAIKSKSVDYLLKPVNRGELNQAMHKAVEQLEARRRSENDNINRGIRLNMSLPKLKENIYLSLLDRTFHPAGKQDLLAMIGAGKADSIYGVGVIRILNLDETANSRFHGEIGLLHFAVSNMVNNASGPGLQSFCFANPRQMREMITVFNMEKGTEADLAFQSELLLKQIHAALRDLLGIRSVMGVGRPCRDMFHMADAFEAAKAAVLQMNFQQAAGAANAIFTSAPVPTSAPGTSSGSPGRTEQTPEVPSLISRLPLLRSALEAGNLNQAKTVLADFLRALGERKSCRLGDADRAVQDFHLLLRDTALSLGVSPDKLPREGEEKFSFGGFSRDYSNFTEFGELLERMLEYYVGVIRGQAGVQGRFDAEDIKAYIDTHYFEDFKISLFTEKYYLSREYLMKRFKQQFGCGIHEYTQKVRMEKAKEMLGDPSLKIQEISEMLGYRDKNYFSKAFRNYYRMSPTEFRLFSSSK
ncbi:two-component system response regulator [Paenibacillus yonginensis]|uniref:Two-component system response regulator n=1 Tax=Paenibacillus yonginensis TaxID=1462996 RepID=A0A1B1MYB0_9BACL|nr:response regulator [Paenibacillus yonginensis]ANS74168.1 two-component system response regulator [Paenibacillus yonginensis]